MHTRFDSRVRRGIGMLIRRTSRLHSKPIHATSRATSYQDGRLSDGQV